METAKEWVAENAHGRVLATYAPVLGVSESTFWRKYYKNKFTADDIIALARENRINPVQALRECGKLTEEETSGQRKTDSMILHEIAERFKEYRQMAKHQA